MSTKLLNTLAAATTLAGVLTMGGIANAASLVQTASTNSSPTDITDDPLTINQFDPSLGTLESVSIEFTANIEGNATLENEGDTEDTATVSLEGQAGLTLDGQSLLNLTPVNSSTFTVGAGQRNDEQLTATETQSTTVTDTQFLQTFIGNGTLDFLFSASAKSNIEAGGNFFTRVRTTASSDIKVTYNYENFQDVPEPSSILGFGLIAGVGMVSLRKKNWLKMSKV
ncbi:MAG: PEP-CTERM sorting domain-containing protein [Calothrix sp. MO_167.B42]|nr:PEP-CTERM sorting domain-containing protein [Calothrix sp. MO_167.B42]